MKIAIAQFNPTVGAVAENCQRIREWVARAQAERADVVLFPELCVVGYPARDLLDRPAFVKRVTAATREIVRAAPIAAAPGRRSESLVRNGFQTTPAGPAVA